MNTSEMYTYVSKLVDDIPITDDVIGWLNAGQNIMASEVQASFPQLLMSANDPTLSGTFVFPVKWHHIPCLYAAAMYKAQDTSFQEEQMFIQQFNDQKLTFVKYYDPSKAYLDTPNSAQFTAVAGQTTFVINNDTYDPNQGDLVVYINGSKNNVAYKLPDNLYPDPSTVITTTTTQSNDSNSFTLTNYVCKAGDTISCVWEEHFDLVNPPYDFWKW